MTSQPPVQTELTAQELFDRVAGHLLAQRARSADPSGQCLYRGPDGTKCAVGAVITDTDYRPEMEENSAWQLEEKGLLPAGLIPHVELLTDLQDIHDSSAIEDWATELAELAADRGLQWTGKPAEPQP